MINLSDTTFDNSSDRLVALLIRFLNQNGGQLSNRARNKEFCGLTDEEVQAIENKHDEIFHQDQSP